MGRKRQACPAPRPWCRPWRRGGVQLPNCALSDQGGPQAGRAGPAPACWRPPAGIGRAGRPCMGTTRTLKTSGLRPEPRPSSEIGRGGSPRRAPQGLPASPDGAKVVRPVGRSTLSPSGEAGRSGDCPTRRSADGDGSVISTLNVAALACGSWLPCAARPAHSSGVLVTHTDAVVPPERLGIDERADHPGLVCRQLDYLEGRVRNTQGRLTEAVFYCRTEANT